DSYLLGLQHRGAGRKARGEEGNTIATMLSVSNPHDVHLQPSPLPGWLHWACIALSGVGVAAPGVMSLMEHWRRATFLLGAAMIWLAVVRRTCDSHRVGVSAVRQRRFDMSSSVAIGAALERLSASVDVLVSDSWHQPRL